MRKAVLALELRTALSVAEKQSAGDNRGTHRNTRPQDPPPLPTTAAVGL